MSTLTDEQLLDRLLYANLQDGEQAYICDQCGAFAKDRALLQHEATCPEVVAGILKKAGIG